jgi:hypothetical protein
METFVPCEKCRKALSSKMPVMNPLEDPMSWVYLCDACRRERHAALRKETVRRASDPVEGAFAVRLGLNFEIQALREKIVAMFCLREEDVRQKVQIALEQATTDAHLDAMIEQAVKKELEEVFKRELRGAIQSAVDKKLGKEEWRRKIADRVEREIEDSRRFGGG